jgi:hypothetical protein
MSGAHGRTRRSRLSSEAHERGARRAIVMSPSKMTKERT